MRTGLIAVLLFLGMFLICLQETESKRCKKKPTKCKTQKTESKRCKKKSTKDLVVLKKQNKYTITTQTDTDAGSNSNTDVFIKLHGKNVETNWKKIDGRRGKLGLGMTYPFSINSRDVGEVTKISLKVQPWKPVWIDVRDNTRNKGYMFEIGEWLHKLKNEANIVTLSEPNRYDIQKNKYMITTKTDTVYGARTNTDVFIKIHGENLETIWRNLDNPGNDFELGNTDVFSINSLDVGEITKIYLKLQTWGDKWKPEWIDVRDKTRNKGYMFEISEWLHKLKNESGIVTLSEPNRYVIRKYRLVTKTSTDAGAGTNDHVYIKLYGTYGQSVWTLFDNPHRNDLEQGTTETFDLTLPDLGGITRLDLKLQNKDSWKFDWIQLNDTGRGKVWRFGGGLVEANKISSIYKPPPKVIHFDEFDDIW